MLRYDRWTGSVEESSKAEAPSAAGVAAAQPAAEPAAAFPSAGAPGSGGPLWIKSEGRPGAVPACLCGAQRKFEFQVRLTVAPVSVAPMGPALPL